MPEFFVPLFLLQENECLKLLQNVVLFTGSLGNSTKGSLTSFSTNLYTYDSLSFCGKACILTTFTKQDFACRKT